MLKIDGEIFDINVMKLERKADFLDKYAERTENGWLHRELIGVYYNYKLELGTTLNRTEYERLWMKLTEPVEFHTVSVPDSEGEYTFTAYFSGVGDSMIARRESAGYFDGLTVDFISRAPARTGTW